jgi:hypothetical protein
VTKRGDTKLLQVLVRQARENRLVYVILAEDRLILPEAQAPQPDHNVHEGAYNRGGAHHLLGLHACPGWRGHARAHPRRQAALTPAAALRVSNSKG